MSAATATAKVDKADGGKAEWYLMPWGPLRLVLRAFMFGARKYEPFGWQKIADAKRRYLDAAMRHIVETYEGVTEDPESKLHPLAHAGCCVLIALWYAMREAAEPKQLEAHGIKTVRPVSLASKL